MRTVRIGQGDPSSRHQPPWSAPLVGVLKDCARSREHAPPLLSTRGSCPVMIPHPVRRRARYRQRRTGRVVEQPQRHAPHECARPHTPGRDHRQLVARTAGFLDDEQQSAFRALATTCGREPERSRCAARRGRAVGRKQRPRVGQTTAASRGARPGGALGRPACPAPPHLRPRPPGSPSPSATRPAPRPRLRPTPACAVQALVHRRSARSRRCGPPARTSHSRNSRRGKGRARQDRPARADVRPELGHVVFYAASAPAAFRSAPIHVPRNTVIGSAGPAVPGSAGYGPSGRVRAAASAPGEAPGSTGTCVAASRHPCLIEPR
jgi:hypothetical protein